MSTKMNNASAATLDTGALDVEINASSYDRINGMLVTLIIMMGIGVTFLFFTWLFTTYDFSKPTSGGDTGDGTTVLSIGVLLEDEQPSEDVQDLPEKNDSLVEIDLEAVTDAVSNVRAAQPSGSRTESRKSSTGPGKKDPRFPDPRIPDPTPTEVPDWKRWVINFEAANINEYADQLSHFDIDIGIVHATRNDIWRLHDPGGNPRVIESDRTKENKSLRFSHTNAKMRRWDQTLARRQNIELDETIPCQFYPESTRLMIRRAEAEALQETGKQLSEVQNTIFKVEPGEGGFVFTVIEILYR